MNKSCVGKQFARALSLFIILSILLSLAAVQAECLHANTYTEKSFDGYGEDFTSSQHLVWYEVCTYCSDCGIMISASHNPFYDNGIKLINSKGEKMEEELLLKLERKTSLIQ